MSQRYIKKIAKIAAINLTLFVLAFSLTIVPSTLAKQPTNSQLKHPQLQHPNTSTLATPQQLLQQGEQLFQVGRFTDAVKVLQQAISIYQQSGDNLGQAEAQTNLSLVLEKLGLWKQATEALDTSLKLLGWDKTNYTLKVNNPKLELIEILAPSLDILTGQQLARGNAEAALEIAKRAEIFWQQLGDNNGITRSRINQAQALRFSGFNQRANKILKSISQDLEKQPDSAIKTAALRSLGNVQQQLGDLEDSQKNLNKSLEVARRLQLPQEISLTELSLGNTNRLIGDNPRAIIRYQNAAKFASNPLVKVQAQINQLSLLVKTEKTTEVTQLIPIIKSQLPNLPGNTPGIYARINFARTITNLQTNFQTNFDRDKKDIAEILAVALQQAKAISDDRAESDASGTLAEVYERDKQYKVAEDLARKAWSISQKIDASDISYRWEWLLGRLLKAQGNIEDAIKAYDESVQTLQSLRKDLAGVNREVQFNFRDSVEPIYRQSVELLLQEKGVGKPNLDKVRQRIEALQLAELDNYFREACLSNQFVLLDKFVDRENPNTAIFYPIILSDRLEVILKLPGKPLIRKTSIVKRENIEEIIQKMRANIVQPDKNSEFMSASKQLYKWLIQPFAAELKNSTVENLVFVPDGSLRNIPLAALYDETNQKYLVQNYAIAISPGLQLFTPKPLKRQALNALAGGLSNPPLGTNFAPLPNVESELASIGKLGIPTTTLYNEKFKSTTLEETINREPFRVVHLATHGQFSSKASETFILAADGRINLAQLDRLLRSREEERTEPIELLVLSACETAVGDNRATLGLAGIALRAGARSTLASLWQIGDASTAQFIQSFYRHLIDKKSTAQALRLAQLQLLCDNPRSSCDNRFKRPLYWAPYVLVGNWL
jgi:CHAT domain-containing protein